MNILDRLKQKAKENLKTIVLPEATDVRVLKAASIIQAQKIARPVLIGNEEQVLMLAVENNVDLIGIEIINL
jgi:phosphate acetyltransferase